MFVSSFLFFFVCVCEIVWLSKWNYHWKGLMLLVIAVKWFDSENDFCSDFPNISHSWHWQHSFTGVFCLPKGSCKQTNITYLLLAVLPCLPVSVLWFHLKCLGLHRMKTLKLWSWPSLRTKMILGGQWKSQCHFSIHSLGFFLLALSGKGHLRVLCVYWDPN